MQDQFAHLEDLIKKHFKISDDASLRDDDGN